MQEMKEKWVQSLGGEDSVEEEMAIHSSILAWRSPWTEAWRATAHGVAKSQSWLNTHSSLFSVLDSTYKWYHTVFVFFCLTSLSIMFFSCIHVAANGRVSSFYDWVIFHCVCACVCCVHVCVVCVCVHTVPVLSICWWTLGLLPYLGFLDSAAVNIGAHVSFKISAFTFFWIYTQMWNCW